MSFQVLPASSADSHDLATIFWDAFKTDPIVGPMAGSVPLEQLSTYSYHRYMKTFKESAKNGMKFFKAVDKESG